MLRRPLRGALLAALLCVAAPGLACAQDTDLRMPLEQLKKRMAVGGVVVVDVRARIAKVRLGNDEAQIIEREKKEAYQAEGWRNKAMIGSNGWLETEWLEGKVHESGIPDRGGDFVRSQSLHRSEETP